MSIVDYYILYTVLVLDTNFFKLVCPVVLECK